MPIQDLGVGNLGYGLVHQPAQSTTESTGGGGGVVGNGPPPPSAPGRGASDASDFQQPAYAAQHFFGNAINEVIPRLKDVMGIEVDDGGIGGHVLHPDPRHPERAKEFLLDWTQRAHTAVIDPGTGKQVSYHDLKRRLDAGEGTTAFKVIQLGFVVQPDPNRPGQDRNDLQSLAKSRGVTVFDRKTGEKVNLRQLSRRLSSEPASNFKISHSHEYPDFQVRNGLLQEPQPVSTGAILLNMTAVEMFKSPRFEDVRVTVNNTRADISFTVNPSRAEQQQSRQKLWGVNFTGAVNVTPELAKELSSQWPPNGAKAAALALFLTEAYAHLQEKHRPPPGVSPEVLTSVYRSTFDDRGNVGHQLGEALKRGDRLSEVQVEALRRDPALVEDIHDSVVRSGYRWPGGEAIR